jgi:acetoin utilization deacetylase AcuC-like enzyme
VKITGYVSHSDSSRHDTGWRHPEHQGRLPAVARAVYRDMLTLFDPLLEIEAVPASEAQLALAHDPLYIAHVRARSAEAEAAGQVLPLDPARPDSARVSGASWDAAVAAAGAGITASEAILDGSVRNAFCAVRPPGSGARRDSAEGFALFNNAAIAALYLRSRGVGRVLILEIGGATGAGSGTPSIVARDPEIAYLPLDSGVAAEEMAGAATALRPDFLVLSLGCDTLRGDPLGGGTLEPSDFHPLTAEIRALADARCEGRLLSLLEGGYDPARSAAAVVQHLRALAGLPPAAEGL